MGPQFKRPDNPVSIADPDELKRFLDQHNVNYRTWRPRRFEDLWMEIINSDTLITVEQIPYTDDTAVFRNIRTVTLLITYEKYDESAPEQHRVLRLNEYRIEPNGELKPRDHPQSSVTEKMHWNAPGLEERRSHAVVRVLKEELDLEVSHETLKWDVNLFPVPASLRQTMEVIPRNGKDLTGFYISEVQEFLKSNIELDVRWSSEGKYPGIVVHNQLVHYWLKLHDDHYREDGYIDSEKRYRSIWVPSTG